MNADRLRQAATKIRDTAEPLVDPPDWWSPDDLQLPTLDARYVALMSPPVALAVADWLDDEAKYVEANADTTRRTWTSGDAVADLILGDAP